MPPRLSTLMAECLSLSQVLFCADLKKFQKLKEMPSLKQEEEEDVKTKTKVKRERDGMGKNKKTRRTCGRSVKEEEEEEGVK